MFFRYKSRLGGQIPVYRTERKKEKKLNICGLKNALQTPLIYLRPPLLVIESLLAPAKSFAEFDHSPHC